MHVIEPEIQKIIDSNSADIANLWATPIDRSCKEEIGNDKVKVYSHLTNVKILFPTEIGEISDCRPLVKENPKNKKFLVQQNEPLVEIFIGERSEIILAPFAMEILAFNHAFVSKFPQNYLCIGNMRASKKRKDIST